MCRPSASGATRSGTGVAGRETLMARYANEAWNDFLSSGLARQDASSRHYGAFSIGDSKDSADRGAWLILSGTKTATSPLGSDYGPYQAPPKAGDYSVVLDGSGHAVCIVETTRIWAAPFRTADAEFAEAYGEWDRTLETWLARCGDYYASECRKRKLSWSPETELIYERFRVVYPGSA